MGVPRQIAVLLLLPALLGVLVRFGSQLIILVHRPIEKVLLGDCLQLWPSRTKYTVHEVAQIEFVTGSVQDYAEFNIARRHSRDAAHGTNAIGVSFDWAVDRCRRRGASDRVGAGVWGSVGRGGAGAVACESRLFDGGE